MAVGRGGCRERQAGPGPQTVGAGPVVRLRCSYPAPSRPRGPGRWMEAGRPARRARRGSRRGRPVRRRAGPGPATCLSHFLCLVPFSRRPPAVTSSPPTPRHARRCPGGVGVVEAEGPRQRLQRRWSSPSRQRAFISFSPSFTLSARSSLRVGLHSSLLGGCGGREKQVCRRRLLIGTHGARRGVPLGRRRRRAGGPLGRSDSHPHPV